MKAKYQDKLRNAFVEAFKTDWAMADDDYDKLLEEMFSKRGFTYEQMSEEVEKGVSLGYSVEVQMQAITDGLKKIFIVQDQIITNHFKS